MLLKKLSSALASTALASLAWADAPSVVTDIAPVHSLVAQVMKGVAEPTLLIGPEYSPHEYSLRPSEARALANADFVFWVGEGLTPWLEKSIDTLAKDAKSVTLMEIEGITLLDFREGATFEDHDHGGHDEHGHDEHKHDEHGHDHDEHAHENHGHDHDEHEHDDHGHDHDEHGHDDHGHNHEGHDPHVWLDPVNAQVWVKVIAESLAEADPENANLYRSNAQTAHARLETLINRIQSSANQMNDIRFIVFHDAYQYFENRFGVFAAGAISVSDAADPSPARIAEIRDTVADLNVRCVFTEPQYNPNMVKSVFKGTEVLTIGVIDPLGATLSPGENQYYELIESLMTSLSQCRG